MVIFAPALPRTGSPTVWSLVACSSTSGGGVFSYLISASRIDVALLPAEASRTTNCARRRLTPQAESLTRHSASLLPQPQLQLSDRKTSSAACLVGADMPVKSTAGRTVAVCHPPCARHSAIDPRPIATILEFRILTSIPDSFPDLPDSPAAGKLPARRRATGDTARTHRKCKIPCRTAPAAGRPFADPVRDRAFP